MKPTSGFHRGAYAAYGNGVFEIDECRHCGMERKTGLWGEYGPVGKQDRRHTGTASICLAHPCLLRLAQDADAIDERWA